MKTYSQITFEFQEPAEEQEKAGVGVRIKSLKKTPPPERESSSNPPSGAPELNLPTEDPNSPNPPSFGASPATMDGSASNDGSAFNDGSASNDGLAINDGSASNDGPASDKDEEAINLLVSGNDTDTIDDASDDHDSPDPLLAEETEGELHTSANPEADGKLKSTRGRKSLKNTDDGTGAIRIPPDEELFKKQYYSIGEVAGMFQVNQSLLRFWETEFDIIQPRKNRKGDRHFRPVDIKNLLLIHDLLRRRKLTIEGAKDFLKKNKRSPERFAMIQSLQKIKNFLLEVRATL